MNEHPHGTGARANEEMQAGLPVRTNLRAGLVITIQLPEGAIVQTTPEPATAAPAPAA